MTRRLAALALVAVLLAVPVLPAAAALADRVGATFALMSDDLLKIFEPIEGLVVAIDGDEIFLDLHAGQGAQVGQEYTIFRKGETFAHPLTGRVLGRYEDVLGYAQVRRVHERFSTAVFLPREDAPPPRVGDGARITRARLRVAVTPMLDLTTQDHDLRRVPFMLAAGLRETKRFQVVDPLAVVDAFASGSVRVEEVLARPDRAVRAARNLDVVGWVVPILIERRGVTYLDVTYVSAVTGAAIFSRRLPVVPSSELEEQRFPWEPRPED